MDDMQRLVIVLLCGLVVLALYTFQKGTQPDANLISLAVRATVFALPSPMPQIVEVTRVVEVTRMVEVVRYVIDPRIEVTPTLVPPTQEAPTPVPPIPTDAASPTPIASAPEAVALAASVPQVEAKLPDTLIEAAPLQAAAQADSCPATSTQQYTAIPVAGGGAAHPDAQHGDLNLALRGYEPTGAEAALVDINGPTDGDAPQLAGVLGRLPAFGQSYRARDWNWACGERGCRGETLSHVEVSLVALRSSPGEPVHVPSRNAEIYGGGFVALVVYAEPSRMTVVYTREDSVANGYAVHLEEFCVDPNLLALYQASNAAGRGTLPAVRNGEAVGTARYDQLLVGVRDRGSFTDPRSRKDWWRGY